MAGWDWMKDYRSHSGVGRARMEANRFRDKDSKSACAHMASWLVGVCLRTHGELAGMVARRGRLSAAIAVADREG